MATPTQVTEAFFAEWSKGADAMYASLRTYLTADCVWENIGVTRTVGPEEAVACFSAFDPDQQWGRMDVEMLHIAESGSCVLMERIDHVMHKDGHELMAVRVMGAVEVRDGKITGWRDYFDTLPFGQK